MFFPHIRFHSLEEEYEIKKPLAVHQPASHQQYAAGVLWDQAIY
jgi:hypothetical protein